ncbi:hypothetical protein BGW36DRAFT_215538 [Talaromyces proteolyticus]|uniref:Uncharacterized protein n=1 Tax=Talaromyces proteolyticus TaxID=1131652 RepID=A0AAD4KN25_9EURO|nr:uncharacterized protein BGW36DRAFT_215538 [Talaromyces proteolyticus]KAH8694070.1 hypothetical protein BGW36DRAFT_215538 [Talaromyces proteolyticus]
MPKINFRFKNLFSSAKMSRDSTRHDAQKVASFLHEDEAVTWEHWEYAPPRVRGCSSQLPAGKLEYSELAESVTDCFSLDCPYSYHIEDIRSPSPIRPVPSLNTSFDIESAMPKPMVSQSSSPSADSTYDSWSNADEVPTRPTSAVLLQDFPPLFRCRDYPAMGFIEDVVILDLNDDYSSNCCYSSTNTSKDSLADSVSPKSHPCKECLGCKDEQSWSTIFCRSSASAPLIRHSEQNGWV